MKASYLLTFAAALVISIYFITPKETFISHDCQLSLGPCTISKDSIKLTFELGPLPLSANQAFEYQLQVSGFVPEMAYVHLVGHSMHMEEDIVQLSKEGPNTFKAKKMLPLCSERKMQWKAIVILKNNNEFVRSSFDFEVIRS